MLKTQPKREYKNINKTQTQGGLTMYARQITSEETYTLSEAKRIINAERKAKRENILYYAKQKSLGLLEIGVSIATPILLDGDATISVITLPLGLYLLFTKKKVIN